MADPNPGKPAELNALGLPKSEHGVGPTTRPDLTVDEERREIERGVYERRTFTDRPAEAHWAEGRPAPIASEAAAAGQDLTADPLRAPGDERNRPVGAPTPEGVSGENEQQGARLAHAKAQSGETAGAAPDQTRGQGRQGGVNETEGQ